MIKKIRNNIGDANTISMIFVLFLLVVTLFTVIDAGVYFNNRHVISNAAQNGARTAAIFGGTTPNKISLKYGVTGVDPSCSAHGISDPVSCSVLKELEESTNTINVEIKSIKCGPGRTTRIGDRTYCEINYEFKGTPGSGLAFAQFFGDNRVRMTAESEVVHK